MNLFSESTPWILIFVRERHIFALSLSYVKEFNEAQAFDCPVARDRSFTVLYGWGHVQYGTTVGTVHS